MPKAKAQPKRKKPTKTMLQVQQNKKNLLEALEKSLGVVTTACKSLGIDRTAHYRYMDADPEYAEAVADLSDVALDFAESQLHKQIAGGNPTSTIFYLKTKGKKRGYIETTHVENTGPGGGPIQHEITKIELIDE